jgi:hypothetical protein
MGTRVLSDAAYRRVANKVKASGSTTHVGEQHIKKGTIHQMVDPSALGLVRRSLPRLELVDGVFVLSIGVPMLVERRLDTTGSMGGNIDVLFHVLPESYKILKQKVLSRYDIQIMNGTFQDVRDKIVAYRSQAEMGEKIAEQLTFMYPERDGNDFAEDPQYSLFGGAFLTSAFINQYGLKYYDFSIGDAPGRDLLDPDTLVRVYGSTVYEKVAENGFQIKKNDLPTAQEIGAELSKRAHAFFLQIGDHPETTSYWKSVLGSDRVVKLPYTALLPYVEAVIMGLTEGILDLQTVEDFLRESKKGITRDDVALIKKYTSNIPIGAQAALPNFNKIPLKGAKFAQKRDLWPIAGVVNSTEPKPKGSAPKKDKMWL